MFTLDSPTERKIMIDRAAKALYTKVTRDIGISAYAYVPWMRLSAATRDTFRDWAKRAVDAYNGR